MITVPGNETETKEQPISPAVDLTGIPDAAPVESPVGEMKPGPVVDPATRPKVDLSDFPDAEPEPAQVPVSPLVQASWDSEGLSQEDMAAAIRHWAKTGQSPAFTVSDPDALKTARDSLAEPDLTDLERRAPAVARWMSDPVKFALARGDAPALADAERGLKKQKKSILWNAYNKIINFTPLAVMNPFRLIPGYERIERDAMHGVLSGLAGMSGALEWQRGSLPFQFAMGGLTAAVSLLDRQMGLDLAHTATGFLTDEAAANLPAEPGFSDKLASGLGSMGLFFIPGMGAASTAEKVALWSPRAARWLGASVMAVMEAGMEAGNVYSDAQRKGFNEDEANNAAAGTFWLNLPLLVITNKLGILGESGGRIKRFLIGALMEGTQEGSQTLISNAAIDETTTAKDLIESAAIGAIIGGPFALMTPGVLPEDAQKTSADLAKMAIDSVKKLGESNMAGLMPEAYEDLVRQIGAKNGLPEKMFLPADELAVLFQDGVMDQADTLEAMNLAESDFLAAVASGSDVAFDFGRLAQMVKLPEFGKIEPSIQFSPHEDIEAATRMLDQALADQVLPETLVAEMDRLEKEVDDLGLGDPNAGKAYAKFMAARATTWANPLKLDPAELLKKIDIKRTALTPEQLKEIESGQVSRQTQEAMGLFQNPAAYDKQGEAKTESPAFKKWSGGAPVIKNAGTGRTVYLPEWRTMTEGDKYIEYRGYPFETGKPVVVKAYHGSPFEFTEFEDKYLGTTSDARSARQAHFFSGTPETAGGYAAARPDLYSEDAYFKADQEIKLRKTKAGIKEIDELLLREYNERRSFWKQDIVKEMGGPDKFSEKIEIGNKRAVEAENRFHDNLDKIQDEIDKIADKLNINNLEIIEIPRLTPKIYPVYVNFQNPYVFDMKGEQYREKSYDEILTEARKAGYDGVIIKDTADGDALDNIFAAFSPTQIKSVNNRGTWDPNDPRILLQSAYQGSPTRGITKMSTDYIGTGEGAQAFGWGLYFAGKKEVAEFYRERLSSPTYTFDALSEDENNRLFSTETSARYFANRIKEEIDVRISFLLSHGMRWMKIYEINAVVSNLLDEFNRIKNGRKNNIVEELSDNPWAMVEEPTRKDFDVLVDIIKILEKIKESKNYKINIESGQLYKVDLPDDADLLDWDKPLGEQPAKVQKLLKKHWPLKGQDTFEAFVEDEATGDAIYRMLSWHFAEPSRPQTGISHLPEETSRYLASIGIPGHRFLDQGSRGKGEGTHNYVIYDDSKVDILETYYQSQPEKHAGVLGKIKALFAGKPKPPKGAMFYRDGKALIRLFETGDLSTLIHETAHVFRRDLAEVAAMPEAPEFLREDWRLAQGFVGAVEGQEWTREQEEQWAKGFEAYILEGKAPRADLRRIFERFRQFLVSLYRNVRSLGVELTPEVRGVFDRLLATDEEIANAKAQIDLNDYFAAAGVQTPDPVDMEGYYKKLDDARAAAAAEMLQRKQKELSDYRKGWYRDAKALVAENPIYKAMDDIVKRGGLNAASIAQDYDAGGVESLSKRHGLIKKNGTLTIDEIAQEYGYEYSDVLWEELVNIPTKKEAIARYVAEQEAAWDAAWTDQDGAITDEYLELLEEEERLITRGMPAYKPVTNKELKKIIERETGIRPAVEVAAEAELLRASLRKASHVSRKVYRAGKLDEAARQKAIQREQAIKVRSRVDAQKDVERIRRYFKKVIKLKPELTSKSGIEWAYMEQIRSILGRFTMGREGSGPGVRSILPERMRGGQAPDLRTFLDEREKQGETPVVAEWLFSASPRPLRSLAYSDLKELYTSIKSLETVGRDSKRQILTGEKKETADLSLALSANIRDEYGADRFDDDSIAARAVKEGRVQNFKKWMGELWFLPMKVEFICRALDGFKKYGPVWKSVYLQIKNGQDVKYVLQEKIAADENEAWRNVSKGTLREWRTAPITIPGVPALAYANKTIGWTKEKAMMVATYCGQAEGWDRMQAGYGLNRSQVQAVLDSLSPAEWGIVRAQWAINESHVRKPYGEAYEAVTGVPLEMIEGVDLTASGIGKIKGGYFKLQYDTRLDKDAKRWQAMRENLNMPEAPGGTAKVYAGSTHLRQKAVKRPLFLNFDAIGRQFEEHIHYASHAVPVRNVWKLIHHPLFQASVETGVGEPGYRHIEDWVKEMANPRRDIITPVERLAGSVRRNATVVMLGLKVSVTLLQFSGLFIAAKEVGGPAIAKGMLQFCTAPRETARMVFEKSAEMRARTKNLDREINDFSSGLRVLRGRVENAKELSFITIKGADLLVSIPTWRAEYEKVLRETGNETAAREAGDSAVRTTQGAGGLKDLSRIQRGGEGLKALTMFYSAMSVIGNQIQETAWAGKRRKLGAFGVTRNLLYLVVFPAIAEAMLRGWDWPDDPEESAVDIVDFLLGTVPIVRDFAPAGVHLWQQRRDKDVEWYKTKVDATPLTSILETGAYLTADGLTILSGDWDELKGKRSAKNLGMAAGYLWGLPSSQGIITTEGLIDLITGETRDPSRLLVRERKDKR